MAVPSSEFILVPLDTHEPRPASLACSKSDLVLLGNSDNQIVHIDFVIEPASCEIFNVGLKSIYFCTWDGTKGTILVLIMMSVAGIQTALQMASRARVQKFGGVASRVYRRLAIVFHLNHIVMAGA